MSAQAALAAVSPSVTAEAASEPPTFRSLKDKISKQTLKGLTVSPFNLDRMTHVQSLVTALLPDLAGPYDPSAPPNPDAPRDLLVRARTGTGKTLAFLIPAIEHRIRAVDQHVKNAAHASDPSSILAGRIRNSFRRRVPGALVLSPTRELATQIANVALKLTEHHKDFQVGLFVGGESKGRQLSQWNNGFRDIVVATPGRLRDVLENHSDVRESMKSCNFLILDEADTLLDMGFRDDIDAIAKFLAPPQTRQTFLFSATLSRRIRQIATTHLSHNHQFLDAAPPASGTDLSNVDKLKDNARVPWAIDSDDELVTHAHIPQYYTPLPSPDAQIPALLRLIAHDQLIHGFKSKIIVFCPTTHSTAFFSTVVREFAADGTLPAKNTRVFEMHSKLTQAARQRASREFREPATTSEQRKHDRRLQKRKFAPAPTILVTSDVSARGVDYPHVTRVVQLGIPSTETLYVHRVGRTGRGLSSSPLSHAQEEPPHRSDMLLLPWEAGYFSRHLHQCPVKVLPLETLESQVAAVASAPSRQYSNVAIYDASSTEDSPGSKSKADNNTSGDKQPDSLSTRFRSLIPLLDTEAVRQTVASLLGHYLPLAGPLHVSAQKVLSGLSDWSRTFGVDMGRPSEAWLRRMGVRLEDKAGSPRKRLGDLIDSPSQKRGPRRFPDQRFDKSTRDGKTSKPRNMSFRSSGVRKSSF